MEMLDLIKTQERLITQGEGHITVDLLEPNVLTLQWINLFFRILKYCPP
jgi:hypothetical protein